MSHRTNTEKPVVSSGIAALAALLVLASCAPETGYRVHVYRAEVADHNPLCIPPLQGSGGSGTCDCWDGEAIAPCDVGDPATAPDPYAYVVAFPPDIPIEEFQERLITRSTAVRRDTYEPVWEQTLFIPADGPLNISVLILDEDDAKDPNNDDILMREGCSFLAADPLPTGSFWCGDLDKGGAVGLYIERI